MSNDLTVRDQVITKLFDEFQAVYPPTDSGDFSPKTTSDIVKLLSDLEYPGISPTDVVENLTDRGYSFILKGESIFWKIEPAPWIQG